MSLRTRLALTFALVVAVSLLVAAASLSALLRGYGARLTQARLDDVAQVVFIQARNMLQRGQSPAQVLDYLGDQADELDVRILLLDREGRVIREAGQESGLLGFQVPLAMERLPLVARQTRQPLRGTFVPPRERATYQFSALPVAPLPVRPGEAAALVVAQPEVPALVALRPLLVRLGIAAGAGLLAGLLAAVLLARWLGRPLANLLAATRAMARGDYAQRVPLEGPPELARLADGFNRMAAEVERSRQIVQRFVGTLSHELRTPLTSIRGFAQAVLDRRLADPDELRRAMRIVDHEARRMQRLSAELLDLSRLQAGEVPLRREPLDLAALVGQCAEVLAARAHEQRARIDLDLPADLAVPGDPDRLEQVFTNLLDNALKFTPPDRTISIRGRFVDRPDRSNGAGRRPGRPFGRARTPPPPRRYAEVAVANPGPEIAPEDLPRIFEQFYTGRAGHERGGTGLGLPIAPEIARAHGGDVTAESAAGQTTFRVLLPADPAGRDAAVTPPPLTAARGH